MEEVVHAGSIKEFWSPKTIRILFSRQENPIASFPDPILLQNFLEEAIVKDRNYNWESLGVTCPKHPIFSGYSHIPMLEERSPETEPGTTPQSPRERLLQENLRNFIGVLRDSMHLLLFAQRDFIGKEFQEFQQWDLVLEDTNCPWDWDHIYPSAYYQHDVYPKYRDWHNTIGNKRAEGLSSNRGHGASLPKDKLTDPKTRKDSFISEDEWEEIQLVGRDITDPDKANFLCHLILMRMARIYGEWHTTLGIAQLMA